MIQKNKINSFWKLGEAKYNTANFSISENGDLLILNNQKSLSVRDLVLNYGSPLQIFMADVLHERVVGLIEGFNQVIKEHSYAGLFSYYYPMKTNHNKEVLSCVLDSGAHVEVSSVNELHLVKTMLEDKGMKDSKKIICNGTKDTKYFDLIDEMHEQGFHVVPIMDNLEELPRIKKYKGDVGVRVDLKYRAHTHWDKKFDRFGLTQEETMSLEHIPNLKILHYHIGSQIKKNKDVVFAAKYAFKFYAKLQKKQNSLDTLNIGGGMGLPYEKNKNEDTHKLVVRLIKSLKYLSKYGKVKEPNVIVEWGQYVVAPSQITIFKIISHKKINRASAKRWCVIDGSFMNDLKDTWAINQKWHITPVNNFNSKLEKVWLAGNTCDSDDRYTGDKCVLLPIKDSNEDQYIAVYDTGAYQDSLASYHCLLSNPTKIMLKQGEVYVLNKRKTADELGRLFGWS